MTQEFQDIPFMDKNSVNNAFLSNDAKEICKALVSMVHHEPDWHLAQEKCLIFLSHSDSHISGLAATCLGHIARIHRTLDKAIVIRTLKAIASPEIAGQIEDALDDINMFAR